MNQVFSHFNLKSEAGSNDAEKRYDTKITNVSKNTVLFIINALQ